MKRPSFLTKLKEQQRKAKADRKREERRARQRAARSPDSGVEEDIEPVPPESEDTPSERADGDEPGEGSEGRAT